MSDQVAEKDAPFFVSAGASRALTEAARIGRDINIAGALYRKINHGESASVTPPAPPASPEPPRVGGSGA
jgi:hypothetical protein